MSEFDALHFIRPLWLCLLPLVVILPWAWKRTLRPSGDWSRVCDPHLLRWLSVKQVHDQVKPRGPWLGALALLIVILALAGPTWQKLPDASFSARDARVIVFDLSQSMLAGDLRPDRLTRARFRLADLLMATQEGQTGLVAYAGDAYVVSPLTSDTNTIANMLPALRPDIIPVAGSRADLALDLAASLFERSGFSRGEVLLVTDSADSRDAASARKLRDQGILTSVLAVGTPEGAPIPSGGGFVNDRSGNVVIARIDRQALRSVAEAGGGKYTELGPDAGDSNLWLDQEGSEFTRREDALGERWRDAGPWLVLLLIPLALVGFRRGLFFMLPLLLFNGLAVPTDARADWWDNIWQRKDQQAYQALAQEDAAKAAALARDPELSGEAWYRSGEFPNSLQAWDQSQSVDSHYNRGNALAQMGEYDAALDAYDQALAQNPDMEDALFNRALVEQMQAQEQQQQEQQEGDQGEPQDGESSDQQDGEQQDESDGEQGEQGEPSEPGEGEEQAEPSEGEPGDQEGEPQMEPSEAWTEEDAQAMEQWLRRIPDDPGGLLRRKFRNEHQRRGAPDDETEAW